MIDPGLGPGREFAQIRRLAARLGQRARGLGDDCAVVDLGGLPLVVSTDLTVEGVHFRRSWLTPAEIGWRATAAALSDLAAAGATPLGILVSLAVPADDAELVEEIMHGAGEACAAAGGRTAVLGGDLSAGPVITVDVCSLGSAARPVGRGGAQPGDSLWVTGTLGGSRAALELWRAGVDPPAEVRDRFVRPQARLEAGRLLAAAGARAMIDVSDGLAGDVAHIAARSRVAVTVDLGSIPVGPGVAGAATRRGAHPGEFAAAGGEDYELLAAMPVAFGRDDAERVTEGCGVTLTRVGGVTEGEGVRLLLDGVQRTLNGFDHFDSC